MSFSIIFNAGALRMSSVLGLNDSPSTPMVLPSITQSSCSRRLTNRRQARSLICSIARTNAGSMPAVSSVFLKAAMSLGKQLPPNPMPGLKNCRPIRGSMPMASSTSRLSAWECSQSSAMRLAKEILAARKVFAPCLISSALRTETIFTGAWIFSISGR